MFKRILLPTDGSDVAHRAGQLAISMAEAFDAHLFVATVVGSARDGQEEAAVEELAEQAAEAGVEVDTEIIETNQQTHRAILDFADEIGADAIVMGTHGRTGINRFLLGSVAMKTLQEAEIPVVTVHEDSAVEFEIENVLLPTDGSQSAEAAASRAIDFAKATDATLHVLYVTPDDPARINPDDTPVKAVQDMATDAGLEDVEAVIRGGRPHLAIASYVAEGDIDLVFMGTHGRTGLRRYLLGSVTERTVRFSPVPVVAVRPRLVTTTVEYVAYDVVEEQGWSLEDDDLFEKAQAAGLSEDHYGTFEIGSGEYILDAAEAAGNEWPFYCRAGGCVNCAAVLHDGDVEMDRCQSLSDEEVNEQNFRLTCVATAESDSVRLVYNAKEHEALKDRVI